MGEKIKTLARFATESRKITGTSTNPELKLKLFEPTKDLILSVFYINDLDCEEIKKIGVGVVKKKQGAKRLYGWGKFSEEVLEGIGLYFHYDNIPPRHGNILGWSDREPEKEQQQLILLRHARAIKLTPPISVS